MRGQRLFVRPIDTADHDAVAACLRAHGDRAGVPACGLLGKLVGELVAVLAMEITDDALRIDDLVVAKELRRKRIGRVMLQELDQLAAKMDRRRLVVAGAGGAAEFFRRVGFADEGEILSRRVR